MVVVFDKTLAVFTTTHYTTTTHQYGTCTSLQSKKHLTYTLIPTQKKVHDDCRGGRIGITEI
eukprot:scaffold2031_cov195-Chaetoceros_neogracile.AAC.1